MNIGLISAISGLSAMQQMLNATGGNLANVNTSGYKSTTVNFQEALGEVLRQASAPGASLGGVDPQQMSGGVQLGELGSLFTQGNLNVTGRPTDMAINGSGFFVLGTPDGGQAFTRNGNFTLDRNGNLVNANGLKVMGWPAVNGKVDTTQTPSGIIIPTGETVAAKATTQMSMGGNLDASAAVFNAGPPATGGQFTSQAQVFDSLGVSHTIQFTFTRAANNASGEGLWNWTATADGGAAGSGSVAFNPNGTLDAANSSAAPTLAFAPTGGASPVSIALDFSSVTQLSSPGASSVVATKQDGTASGSLQNFTVNVDGTISGQFTNGLNVTLGRVALATFADNDGLLKDANGLFEATGASGTATTDPASQVGRVGTITAGALEASNVDLGTEFTRMIVAQRAFQANSRMITTIDQVLDELANLKRA